MVKLFILTIALAAAPASAANVCAPCDFDGSGTITIADQAVMLGAFGTKVGQAGYDARVDYDGSGTITIKDWSVFLKFCIGEK